MFAPLQNGHPVAPKVGIHSFKAGKLNRVEGTKKVKPDQRKGLVYLEEVDELLHFYWKDRNTGAIEDDLIIFPEEAELIKVKESPSGRVFALKFSSSSQIMFYWMQEKDAVNDEADVKRVNDLIADPKAPAPRNITAGRGLSDFGGLTGLMGSGSGDSGGGLNLSAAAQTMGLSQDQLMQILGSEDLSQLMGGEQARNLFGASASGNGDADMGGDVFDSTGSGATLEQMPQDPAGPTGPSGEAGASAGQQAAISHINDETSTSGNALRDILAGIRVPERPQAQSSEPLELQDVLTTEVVLPLLADEEVRRQLFPHLPSTLVSDPPTESEVREIMTSVQWRQALSGLSYALNNGGESVIRSLGLETSNLEGSSGVEAFLRAVSKALEEEVADSEGEGDVSGDRMEE